MVEKELLEVLSISGVRRRQSLEEIRFRLLQSLENASSVGANTVYLVHHHQSQSRALSRPVACSTDTRVEKSGVSAATYRN
jgi:ACT domain-containing protein